MFWLVGGRVADWGAAAGRRRAGARTAAALRGGDRAGADRRTLPPDEVDEARIVAWLARHDAPPELALDPPRGGWQRSRRAAAGRSHFGAGEM